MANVINWCEIPASNFDRACDFYSKVLGGDIQKMDMPGGMKMGFLPGTNPEVASGAVVHADGYQPTDKGTVVYLNGGDDLNTPLGRVEAAGGKIIMPKTSIGENGFMAHFLDTEGNHLAFHSMK